MGVESALRQEEVVDVLGLMGDASDNIPGVRGIGEKGAKELVASSAKVDTKFRA